MSDKKQPKIEQPEWLHEAKLWVKEQWPMPFLGVLVVVIISCCICSPYLSPEQRAANDHTALIVYLIGLAVTGGVVLCIPRVITSNPKKYFITRVLVTGITGGAFALLLPIAVKSTTTGVGGLRHSILLATGGLLAILTLGETRRKNDIDKRKNEQEKEKNDKDHRRQVRAERRERYTKAVEQLGDEKAPIRMGGVYTLVGLVDEWLEDKNLSDDQRLKEGQVIINNLCAYIRSPFTLASYYDESSQASPTPKGIYKDKEEFYADKAVLEPEADVRLSIIKEIHDRIQGPDKNTPGAWSDFEYDFSGSTFFYPVDLTKSYYKKPVNFSGATYQGWADFSRSTYEGRADFSRSTYKGEADFQGSTYKGEADFQGSTYTGWADFGESTYEKNVIFSTFASRSAYEGGADFSHSTYQGKADFQGSTYKGEADFGESTYEKNVIFSTFASRSAYEGGADFHGSTYKGGAYFSRSTYKGEVYFHGSTYKGRADFHGSTYKGRADFHGSTYKGRADFHGSTYKGRAYFSRSTYEGGADFHGSTYKGEVYFHGSTYTGWADFSRSAYTGWADFSRSAYEGRADFHGSTYEGRAYFHGSTYEGEADFSGSIFYSGIYFGQDGDNGRFSRFTDCAPQFYDETNHKNTLFGSPNNDFTVENGRDYPIYRNFEGLPLGCKFLTSEQKEYLADKFQEIEETNNKLREVKDLKEKAELSEKLRDLNNELHEWRGKATTVYVEDVAEDTES